MAFLGIPWPLVLETQAIHQIAGLFCFAGALRLTSRVLAPPAGQARNMSPEAISVSSLSSLFPDRPIRPLPKRRLRERLSPEVAESIEYPPASHTTTPLFYYPYTTKEDAGEGTHGDRGSGPAPRSAYVTRAPAEILSRARTLPKTDQAKYANSGPPPSASSSIDGYDAIENTNNKKKRKIPSAGESVLHGSLNDLTGVSVSATVDSTSYDIHGDASATPLHHGTSLGAGSQGISGPGEVDLAESGMVAVLSGP